MRALRDLRAIHDYIAASSPAYARRMADRLIARTLQLADQPRSGRAVPEFDRPDIRELVESPYRIVYRFVEGSGTAFVLAVIHGRRRLPDL